jgi:hypothetical protein
MVLATCFWKTNYRSVTSSFTIKIKCIKEILVKVCNATNHNKTKTKIGQSQFLISNRIKKSMNSRILFWCLSNVYCLLSCRVKCPYWHGPACNNRGSLSRLDNRLSSPFSSQCIYFGVFSNVPFSTLWASRVTSVFHHFCLLVLSSDPQYL